MPLIKQAFLLSLLVLFSSYADHQVNHSDEKNRQNLSQSTQPLIADKDTARLLNTNTLGEIFRYLEKNKLPVPITPEEWSELISSLGTNIDLVVPFSFAPKPTDLGNGRSVFSLAPKDTNVQDTKISGHFYLAANHHDTGDTFEFIALNWGKESAGNDFGTLTVTPKGIEVKIVNKAECLKCHKSEGPHFTTAPWSTTTSGNPALARAFLKVQAEKNPTQYGAPHAEVEAELAKSEYYGSFLNKPAVNQIRFKGARIFTNDRIANDFEADVIQANERTWFYRLLKDVPQHRAQISKIFLKNLILEQNCDEKDALFIDSLIPPKKPTTWQKLFSSYSPLLKSSPNSHSLLHNFVPEDGEVILSDGKTKGGMGNVKSEADFAKILEYNDRRKKGSFGIPKEYSPTMETAFFKLNGEEEAAQGDFGLARDILCRDRHASRVAQISDNDHEFIENAFKEQCKGTKSPSWEALVNGALNSPLGTNLIETGSLLRNQIMDWITKEIQRACVNAGGKAISSFLMSNVNSKRDTVFKNSPSEALVKSSHPAGSCLQCHSGPNARGGAFPFDIYDIQQWREALRKGALNMDKEKVNKLREATLERLRLGDMPPKDTPESPEAIRLREKLRDQLRSLRY